MKIIYKDVPKTNYKNIYKKIIYIHFTNEENQEHEFLWRLN